MRFIYLHGFASGPLSGKAQFFRRRLAERGVNVEIPTLDQGDFENLTITRQLAVIERDARGGVRAERGIWWVSRTFGFDMFDIKAGAMATGLCARARPLRRPV